MLVPSLGLEDPLEGNGNLLRYSCLGNRLQYSQQGHKEPDMTEQCSARAHTHTRYNLCFEFHLVLAFTLRTVLLSLLSDPVSLLSIRHKKTD